MPAVSTATSHSSSYTLYFSLYTLFSEVHVCKCIVNDPGLEISVEICLKLIINISKFQ